MRRRRKETKGRRELGRYHLDPEHASYYVTACTYLYHMKKRKLTLSLRPSRIAMLRKASARRNKSISEMVEDMAENADKEVLDEGASNISKWAGYLAERIKPSEFEADDRYGAELRKTETYERMRKVKRKKP